MRASLARRSLSARRDLDRGRRQLRALLRARDQGRTVPVRLAGATSEAARITLPEQTDMVWHGYLPDVAPGPALRLPRPRPVRPAAGPPLQPEQGCPRSVREGDGAYDSVGRRDVRLPRRRPGRRPARSTSATTPPFAPLAAVVDPAFTWGDDRPPRTPWHKTVIYEMHVRGFTKLHPGDARARCAAPTRR